MSKLTSDSYEQCYCGADCYIVDGRHAHSERPCWGKVNAVEELGDGEDYWFVHACEGHFDCYEGGYYQHESKRSENEQKRRGGE